MNTNERNYWGMVLKGRYPGDREVFLFETWHNLKEPSWDGEPIWPLLFQTRRQATAWKRNAETRYSYLGWKFRVVRVGMSLTVTEVGRRPPGRSAQSIQGTPATPAGNRWPTVAAPTTRTTGSGACLAC